MQNKAHLIKNIIPGSIAEELGIEAGDRLISIDDAEIEDIFDYQFLIQDDFIRILIEKPDGEQWLLEVEKEFDEDIGIVFEKGLMDDYRHCHNKCIFCFIDQMPPGMRETLYFKDDDSRLSFLQGNYVTLTNMSDHDIDRICRYRLSPINISFQTMNPELRCRMLNNRFAGEALKKVDRLFAAEIRMNGQIVLCKGINDGRELEYSIEQLMKYIPLLESVSVVPVGLTKYREGLYPLEPFEKEDALEVIEIIEGYQKECFEKYGIHFVHASDEWYILAQREVPEEGRYDGYLQLENGVGMLRLFFDEFRQALEERTVSEEDSVSKERTVSGGDSVSKKDTGSKERAVPRERAASKESIPFKDSPAARELSLATGYLAFPYLERMCAEIMKRYPKISVHTYAIRNDYFGERITVSGLLTGGDIRDQLMGKALGEALLLPENVLRSGETVFLDDLTVAELEKALQVSVYIVKSSGRDLFEAIVRGRK